MNALSQRIVVLLACVFVGVGTLAAQVLEPEALKRKQEDQQRAKAMTRELLNGVLDLQLRQLEENDLTDLDVYREIRLMRENLGEIVDAEMTKVVDVLAKAQSLPADQREAAFVEARQMIRTIILTLSAERQNLLRRLKIAELAEQVRRLIALQTKVQTATKQLPQEAKARQQALTLKTVEDQRDVKELFLLLVETLSDVRTWGGALSNAAADGLKLLKAADVGKDLDNAGRTLQAAQYPDAVSHQEAAIRSLRELLKLLQRAQGVMGSDNQSAINKVQELAKRQEALRDETRKLTPTEKTPEALVEQQAKIQQELNRLENAVQQQPQAEAHLEQAKAAAEEATAKLFENQPEQAAAEQTKVLGQLAALEAELKNGAPMNAPEQSAAELAKLVQDLEQAKQQLEQAQQKQEQAEKQAETNAQAAAQPEAQVAAVIDEALKKADLPDSIEGRLEEAKAAAEEAAKELSQAAAEPAKESQRDALENAEDALDRAMTAVETALEDAKRKQAAVEIGELARAAEVLERAAAEEREIADMAREAAKQADADAVAEMANEAALRQAIVESVADKVAESLKQTSPESAKDVAEGKDAAKQSEQALTKAAEMAAQSPEQAKEQAKAAAEQAEKAADKLAAAAQQIREEIAKTAQELADASDKQVDKLQAALAEVEQALKNQAPSPAERMEQLEQAQAKVNEAAKQQQVAAGKPEAAKALELAEKIAEAAKAQEQANELAAAAEKSDAVSPLQAAVEQQNAAEMAQQAAEAAEKRPESEASKQKKQDDALAQALKAAQEAAAQAAKNLVDGNEPAAKAAQETAKSAIETALALAQAEAQKAVAKPAEAPPNAAAQEKANQAAEAAEKLAAQDAPKAAQVLETAVEAGGEAKQDIAKGEPEKAVPAQQKAMDALAQANKNIEAAKERLAQEQAKQLEQQALLADKLAEQTAGLDLGTAEALDAAKEFAEQGAKPDTTPAQRKASTEKALRNLERAAANLATKEQAVRRDQAVAEALADIAEDQMEAADILAEHRDEEMIEPSAAEVLENATTKFAEAQQALGQGAVELSGQTEVANKPLREALELASEFPSLKTLAEDIHRMPMDAAHGMPEKEPVVAEKGDDGEPKPAEVAEGEMADDTPVADADAPLPAIEQPAELGTKFVPKSPEVTAKMMTGPETNAAMKAAIAKMDAAARAKMQQGKHDAKNSALARKLARNEKADLLSQKESDDDLEATQSSDQSQFTKKKNSSPTDNPDVKDGPPQKTEEGTKIADSRGEKSAEHDEAPALRKFREAPWFAKLPPELRKSIRANAQQRAPRAYEDKLRKYFESVD